MEQSALTTILDSFDIPIMILSADFMIEYMNEWCRSLFCHDGNVSVGKHFGSAFQDCDTRSLRDFEGKSLRFTLQVRGKPLQGTVVRFSTKSTTKKVVVSLWPAGGTSSIEALLTDQSVAIFESSNDGIFITDGTGMVLMVNSSYERITGNTKSEIVGKHIKELIAEGYFSESATLEVLRTHKKATVIPKLRNNRDVMVTGAPVFDADGNIIMVVINVRDMSELKALQTELQKAKALEATYKEKTKSFIDIVVNSPLMQDVMAQAKQIAPFPTSVLISGETGVGKEVIADYIQQQSDRNGKPYLKLNCGSIPENLLESELYGYEAGAFTGASKYGKPGIIELANEGTLLLDEIGELPLNLQVKLLRFLQEQKITRIGGGKPKSVDVRIISSTNKDLEDLTKHNVFRSDLFYRLNVIHIKVPSLRERIDDIIPLANFFLQKFCTNYNLTKSFSQEILQCFLEYDWPGNIRELRNLVENLTVSSRECVLDPLNLPNSMLVRTGVANMGSAGNASLKDMVGRTERRLIVNALEAQQGIRAAARSLGLDHATLLRKMRLHDITFNGKSVIR